MATKKTDPTSHYAIIKAWLKSLNDDQFIALAPPTASKGPEDAMDVHMVAAEERDARKLPDDTPYVGWHSQTTAWTGGDLTGIQAIYHGGDREIIRRRLETVPEPFEISGGLDDDMAFLLAVRFDASQFDLGDPDAVEAGLDKLRGGAGRLGDFSRIDLESPLTAGQVEWLHQVLADEKVDPYQREYAMELLISTDAITDAEVEQMRAQGMAAEPQNVAYNPLIDLLRRRGRIDEASALAIVIGEPESLLLAPSPQTLAHAGEQKQYAAQAQIAAALDGTEIRPTAVALAEQLRASGATESDEFKAFVRRLATLYVAPTLPRYDNYLDSVCERTADFLADPSVPAWLLGTYLATMQPVFAGLEPDGSWAWGSRSMLIRAGEDCTKRLAEALAAARERVGQDV